MDQEKGPLWRIKLVKLIPEPEKDQNYAMIVSTGHTIGDGRNIYEISVQLLNIVAALLENQICSEMDESVIEHSLFTNEELIKINDLKFEPSEVSEHDEKNRTAKNFSIPIENGENKFQNFFLDSGKLNGLIAKMKLNAKEAKLTNVLLTIICAKLTINRRCAYKWPE